MKSTISILASILLVQLALTAFLYSGLGKSKKVHEHLALLALNPEELGKLSITEKGKDSLILMKKKGVWTIPALSDFPASKGKIENFVKKVVELKRPYPVATTQAAAKQLKVSSEEFEKSLEFSTGEKQTKTLYLGTSPSFKKAHARVDGENEIYDIEINSYELSITPSDWQDQNFLHFSENEIAKLESKSISLERTEKEIVVRELKENQETNKEAVQSLISKIAKLSFTEVLGVEQKKEYNQDKAVLTYSITLNSGETIEYIFSKSSGKEKKDEDYVLKTSSSPFYFKVEKSIAESIINTNKDSLLREKKSTEKAPNDEKKDSPNESS